MYALCWFPSLHCRKLGKTPKEQNSSGFPLNWPAWWGEVAHTWLRLLHFAIWRAWEGGGGGARFLCCVLSINQIGCWVIYRSPHLKCPAEREEAHTWSWVRCLLFVDNAAEKQVLRSWGLFAVHINMQWWPCWRLERREAHILECAASDLLTMHYTCRTLGWRIVWGVGVVGASVSTNMGEEY